MILFLVNFIISLISLIPVNIFDVEKFVKKINRKVFFILSKICNCLKYERICDETIERCIQEQKFIY